MNSNTLIWNFEIIICRYQLQCDEIKRAFIGVMGLPGWRAVLEKYYAVDSPGIGGGGALPEEAKPAVCPEPQAN